MYWWRVVGGRERGVIMHVMRYRYFSKPRHIPSLHLTIFPSVHLKILLNNTRYIPH